MKRYEIRWTALDPTRGAEMAKTRPAVIVSLNALNRALPTVTVCPLTSQLHPTWRSRLQVRCGDCKQCGHRREGSEEAQEALIVRPVPSEELSWR
jgi:mRNA-degrading endonuclease toxin of MazEF toxin-antitoxin module